MNSSSCCQDSFFYFLLLHRKSLTYSTLRPLALPRLELRGVCCVTVGSSGHKHPPDLGCCQLRAASRKFKRGRRDTDRRLATPRMFADDLGMSPRFCFPPVKAGFVHRRSKYPFVAMLCKDVTTLPSWEGTHTQEGHALVLHGRACYSLPPNAGDEQG